MKTTLLVVLLALSLAANAALFFQRSSSSSQPSSLTNRTGKADSTASATTGQPEAAANASATEAAQLVQTWQRLQSGDLKTLIQQLRAAGFSESMIRSIVSAQVYEQFSARRKALIVDQEETPYWQSQQRFGLDPKTMSALRDLSREQNEQIKALLGPNNALGNEERLAYQRRQFGELPQDKVEQL